MRNKDNFPTLKNSLKINEIENMILHLRPIDSAMYFSGLMLSPELQSNTLRLEALVHLLLAIPSGNEKLTKPIAKELFFNLETSYYGYSEDPAKNVMVALVHYSKSSYRILEGIWEDNAFQLQIFLNIVDQMPDKPPFSNLKLSLWSILNFSEIIINRMNLQRFTVGGRYPLSEIPEEDLNIIDQVSQRTMLTWDELNDFHIDVYDLEAFFYDVSQQSKLLETTFGSSPLEQHPIIEMGDEYHILLPTSIGIAIRNLIISFCHKYNYKKVLEEGFQFNYVKHFSENINLLGEFRELPFQKIKNNQGNNCGVHSTVCRNDGNYFNFILLFDDFLQYEDYYFNGKSNDFGEFIEKNIINLHGTISSKEQFRTGITIIVLCGWGRVMSISMNNFKLNDDWSIVTLSAYELTVFSQISNFNPDNFLRLLEAKNKLKNIGVNLFNINNFLDLYGYAKSNNFHLVPHSDIPSDVSVSNLLMFNANENYSLDIKCDSYKGNDQHFVRSPNGNNIIVKRFSDSWYFSNDRLKPLYFSPNDLASNNLLGLVYGKSMKWWCNPFHIEEENRDFTFRVWDGLCHWIFIVDEILESLLPNSTIKNVVWKWELNKTFYPNERVSYTPNYKKLVSLTRTKSRNTKNNIEVTSIFNVGFQSGFHQKNNDAEKAMITSLVYGISLALPNSRLEVNNIINNIFVTSNAKYTHMMTAQTFHDYVKDYLPKPIFVNDFDNATFRIGLGWLARNINDNPNIRGIKGCTAYLRKLVDAIWLEIKTILSSLNKNITVIALLENHEALDFDTKIWNLTYLSGVELRSGEKDVHLVMTKQISLRDEAKIGSRLALEMALCECNNSGGYNPSNTDLTKLITYTTFLFQMGGVSDAIRYEMIDANITIAPTGDILYDQNFHSAVIKPYGYTIQKNMLQRKVKQYDSYFDDPKNVSTVEHLFKKEFNIAWMSEYGFKIDDARKILDFLENKGIDINAAVFELDIDDFYNLGNQAGLPKVVLQSFIDSMILKERKSWDNIPSGFSMNDILPWRFKRRLSLISKPILKIKDKLIIAPGLLRNNILYLVRNCYEAYFDNNHFKSKKMQQWIGKTRNKVGHQFNKDVATEFISCGWLAESDVFLTKLLNKKINQDYGDIDVVAWNPKNGKVLLIECKDLEFAKTPSEIARQIYEFRGVVRDNGKPDRLLKHLKRIKVIKENINLLEKQMKLGINISLEGCLLFSHLVPMKFSDIDNLKKVELLTFNEIKNKPLE